MTLQDRSLICSPSEKGGSRLKECSDIPTIYSPETSLSPESLHFQKDSADSPPPFCGASYRRWLGIYPFSDIQRLFCEQCRKTKGLQRGGHGETKGTGLHVVSDTCCHFVSWSVADWEPKFGLSSDMVLKSYTLTEVGCGQPNKPRWDCRDVRQEEQVPALEGLFIFIFRCTNSHLLFIFS